MLTALLAILCAIIGLAVADMAAKPNKGAMIEQAVLLPPSEIGRAKFPGADPRDVDWLTQVNKLVNRSIIYTPDTELHGVREYWEMFPVSMRGDCEEYALTKMALLGAGGWELPTQTRLRFATIYIDGLPPGGHVVLEVLLNSGQVAVLDNNFDELMTREELVAIGYRFYDW
jgi:predicted transglutaminase-like cysteine proteinase